MIPIDASDVPADKLTHTDFLKLKTEMEWALAQQKWVNAFCIHEAGHMIYLTQLGVTKYTYLGPRIEYDNQKDAFDGFMALVQAQNQPVLDNNTDVSAFLTTAAKAWAAGGVFAKTLTNASDQGDEQDRDNLNRVLDAIERGYSGVTIDREGTWKQAQEDVAKDLRSHAFRAKAWEEARKIQTILFDS